MRLSLRWLKQYVPVELSLAEVVETLTMLGLEVESVVDLGYESGKFVICEILDVAAHPHSDHLSLCSVQADQAKPIQVVCGATNMKAGDRVVLAREGAVLPDGRVMKKAMIRGIESPGMLCSPIELGYSEDAKGLMILPPDAPVAEPFDALIEIKVTPNRPDCLSVVGVARELAAATQKKLTLPVPRFADSDEKTEAAVRIVVKAREECPRYAARVLRGVKIEPSPLWLQRAVESAGLRPINNVVDVTNYVLIELGHPLHAFDLNKIAQKTVVIRLAEEGEVIETLDGQKAVLTEEDLLITDPTGPIALAGIMGGLRSEISDATTDVLLESAYFAPRTIRRTSKRLDKSTDASYRFERGADPKRLILALERAAQLIQQTAGGEILKGIVDVQGPIPEPRPVWLRIERLNRLLGLTLSGREISDSLKALGFDILRTDGERMQIGVPSHRVDIVREADLFEEVARLWGYDKIPTALPGTTAASWADPPLRRLRARITDILVGAGYNETINYSLSNAEELEKFRCPTDRLVRLKNPLSSEQSVMRTSLVPGMVAAAVRNQNRGVLDPRLFEIGKYYIAPPEASEEAPKADAAPASAPAPSAAEGCAASVPDDLPPAAEEKTALLVAVAGSGKEAWNAPAHETDFYEIKGIAELLLDQMGMQDAALVPVEDCPYLHPGRSAAYHKDGLTLCRFGELHPGLARQHDLRKRLYLLEMELDPLESVAGATKKHRELPRYPAMQRDIALVVARHVPALELERAMRAAANQLLESIRLFDLYEGANIPADKKSLAYGLTFRSPERTLTEDEVNAALDAILKALEKRFGAVLRTA